MKRSKEKRQGIIDGIKKKFSRKNKKKAIIQAETKKEAKKDIEVNKGSFNANQDVREQLWDYLNIK